MQYGPQLVDSGRKGMLLTLSHAWSVGLLLYAAQHAMQDTDALPV